MFNEIGPFGHMLPGYQMIKHYWKSFWQSVQKTGQEGKKETWMAIVKLFTLNTNTIMLKTVKKQQTAHYEFSTKHLSIFILPLTLHQS